MDQKKIQGRQIAYGRVKWEKYGEKESQQGFVFTKNNGFGYRVEKNFIDQNGITMDGLLDIVKQLDEQGLDIKADYTPKTGWKNTGLVLISRKDPRINCSVVLSDDNQAEDIDLSLAWYFDINNEQGNMKGEPERKADKEELKPEKVEEAFDVYGMPVLAEATIQRGIGHLSLTEDRKFKIK